jgi:hypothetical protein
MTQRSKTPARPLPALPSIGRSVRVALSDLHAQRVIEGEPRADVRSPKPSDEPLILGNIEIRGELLALLVTIRPPVIIRPASGKSATVIFNAKTVDILRAHFPEGDWSATRIPCIAIDECWAADLSKAELEDVFTVLAGTTTSRAARELRKKLRTTLKIYFEHRKTDVARSASTPLSKRRRV